MIAAQTTRQQQSHWPVLATEEKHSRIMCGTRMYSTPKVTSWATILLSPLLATRSLAHGRTRHRQKPKQNAARKPGPYCEWAAQILISRQQNKIAADCLLCTQRIKEIQLRINAKPANQIMNDLHASPAP